MAAVKANAIPKLRTQTGDRGKRSSVREGSDETKSEIRSVIILSNIRNKPNVMIANANPCAIHPFEPRKRPGKTSAIATQRGASADLKKRITDSDQCDRSRQ